MYPEEKMQKKSHLILKNKGSVYDHEFVITLPIAYDHGSQ